MPTSLPVPIQFRLPEGWFSASPQEVAASGAVFVARHPQPDAGFSANITIDGEYRSDLATLPEIAQESVERLRQAAMSVVVMEHREVGSAEVPGFIQTLTLSVVADDVVRDLVQSQVYLSMSDVTDPQKRAVIRLVMTATASQYPTVLGDFQDFVRTVQPDARADL
jgi:hypothetical protein